MFEFVTFSGLDFIERINVCGKKFLLKTFYIEIILVLFTSLVFIVLHKVSCNLVFKRPNAGTYSTLMTLFATLINTSISKSQEKDFQEFYKSVIDYPATK